MAIYESYLTEAKIEKEYELAKEDMSILHQAYIETCISIAEDVDEEEYLSEGVNLDNFKVVRTLKKDFKQRCSAYKKAIKAGKYSDAEKEVKAMRKLINDADKEIKANKGNIGSSVIGFFLGTLGALYSNIGWIIGGAVLSKWSGNMAKDHEELSKMSNRDKNEVLGNISNAQDKNDPFKYASLVVDYHLLNRDATKYAGKATLADLNKTISAIAPFVIAGIKEVKKLKDNYRAANLEDADKCNWFTKQCLSQLVKLDKAVDKLEDIVKKLKG